MERTSELAHAIWNADDVMQVEPGPAVVDRTLVTPR